MHYHVWWRNPLPPAAGCSCRQAPKTSHFLRHLCSNSFASWCFLPASLTSVLDDFTRQDALWCMFHSSSSKLILVEKERKNTNINSTDGLPGQKRRRMYTSPDFKTECGLANASQQWLFLVLIAPPWSSPRHAASPSRHMCCCLWKLEEAPTSFVAKGPLPTDHHEARSRTCSCHSQMFDLLASQFLSRIWGFQTMV